MKIGLTATRYALSRAQETALERLLIQLVRSGATELHHGDCVGGDAIANLLAQRHGLRTVIHPPERRALRAFCRGDEVREPLHYGARNQNIVRETDRLIGCPRTLTEELLSGTWSTIRFARRLRRPVAIVHNDGTVALEGSGWPCEH